MKDKEILYNVNNIFVPPTLPQILRTYAKAAIRTQPYDLLVWSASYFKALDEDRFPPVKERLEYPLARSQSGLTVGYLKMLMKQSAKNDEIEKELLKSRWCEISLDEKNFKQILCLAGIYNEDKFSFFKFLSVAASFLSKSLTQTMIILCEIYSEEPDGGSAAISADLFITLYTFLAPIDASKENKYIDGKLEGMQRTDIGEETSDDQSQDNRPLKKIDSFIKNSIEESSDYDKNKSKESKTSSDEIASVDIPLRSESENGKKSSLAKFQSNDSAEKSSTDKNVDAEKESDDNKSQGSNVTLRVFSEAGEKIKSSSAMSIHDETLLNVSEEKTVSVEERQGIIEQVKKLKEEKVKTMEAVMNSLGNLAEKSKVMIQNAEKLCKQKLSSSKGSSQEKSFSKSMSIDSQQSIIDPNAKGVVNPVLKGLFDNVADKMMVIRAFQEPFERDMVIVPPVPGIGPPVDDDTAEEFLKYVHETASDQCNMFMPRDIRHCYCPPLEKH